MNDFIKALSLFSKDFKVYVRKKGHNSEFLCNIKLRIIFVIFIFLSIFSILSFRIISISVFGGRKEISHSLSKNHNNKFFSRAEIVDRNGVLLATNLATKSLYASTNKVIELEESIDKLLKTFSSLDRKTLERKLHSKKKFVWIKRNLTPKEQGKVMMLGLPGFSFKNEEKRAYPQNNLFSHVIGYVDIDNNGLVGIERSFNDYLLGKNNKAYKSLRLSLDIRVQEAIHYELKKAVSYYKADGAVGMVMDVNTSEVYGMVSLPDFNPHKPSFASSNEKFNRATYGLYEMGSIFKIFNTAIAIESGLITKDDLYKITPPFNISGFNISDFTTKVGLYSVEEIFMHSSNIGSAKIAIDFGKQIQERFLDKFGILRSLNTQFLEVSSPIYPKYWNQLSVATIAYGYGVAVTPAHVMQGVASIINGGYFNDISFIPQKKEDLAKLSERVISKSTSDYIRKLMRITVKYGTGAKAAKNKYLIGGKTGTANKLKKGGGYDENTSLTSFIGAFPMNKPKFLIFIMLDNPKQPGVRLTGGKVAAPVFNEIVKRLGAIYSITPINENDYKIEVEFSYDKKSSKI